MKVITVQGTRPEIVRLSEIVKKLDKYTKHVLVHTNQNFDYELNQIFFDQLKLRKPNYLLDVKSDTVGQQIGKILIQCEEVMIKEKPDAVLILGDTNSALSCIVAKRLKIPIFHLEAGNRSFDQRVPEETNRRIVDHCSDINICYTEHSRRNLLREGIHPQNIFVVNSPLIEVYKEHNSEIQNSRILEELSINPQQYFLASIHREENIDNEHNFKCILLALNNLAEKYNMPVIFSTHPRTKKRLDSLNYKSSDEIIFCKPFGMFDFVKLELNAYCVLSDSGTLHEDSAILNIPAVNVRESNERPEAYDAGNIVMSGINTDIIMNSIALVRNQYDEGIKFSNPYGTEANCSDRIVRLLMQHEIVRKRLYD